MFGTTVVSAGLAWTRYWEEYRISRKKLLCSLKDIDYDFATNISNEEWKTQTFFSSEVMHMKCMWMLNLFKQNFPIFPGKQVKTDFDIFLCWKVKLFLVKRLNYLNSLIVEWAEYFEGTMENMNCHIGGPDPLVNQHSLKHQK